MLDSQASAPGEQWLVTRPELAQVLGCSERQVTRLEAARVLKPAALGRGGRGSLFDLRVVVPAYVAHVRAERPQTARERRDSSAAELNELRLARERRELVPVADVVRDGQAFVVATMAKIKALPSRMVRAGLVDETAAVRVAELLGEARQEIAAWQTPLDLIASTRKDEAFARQRRPPTPRPMNPRKEKTTDG